LSRKLSSRVTFGCTTRLKTGLSDEVKADIKPNFRVGVRSEVSV